MTASVDRRSFLRKSSQLAGAAVIAPSLAGLVACTDTSLTSPSRYDGKGVLLRKAPAGRAGTATCSP